MTFALSVPQYKLFMGLHHLQKKIITPFNDIKDQPHALHSNELYLVKLSWRALTVHNKESSYFSTALYKLSA